MSKNKNEEKRRGALKHWWLLYDAVTGVSCWPVGGSNICRACGRRFDNRIELVNHLIVETVMIVSEARGWVGAGGEEV